MKRKFIDVRTSRNGEIVDALCFNEASMEKLMAILTLIEPGDEVLVTMREAEFTMPAAPGASSVQ